jgi:hypothetical protein
MGTPWRPMLEKGLGSSKAVAIFVGPGEMATWQQRELDIALDLQSKSANFPVIPVLLPGCDPPLGLLGQFTWVDLRRPARCATTLSASFVNIGGQNDPSRAAVTSSTRERPPPCWPLALTRDLAR